MKTCSLVSFLRPRNLTLAFTPHLHCIVIKFNLNISVMSDCFILLFVVILTSWYERSNEVCLSTNVCEHQHNLSVDESLSHIPVQLLTSPALNISALVQSITDRVDIQVIPIDLSDVASIQLARASLISAIEKIAEVAELPGSLSTTLSAAWGDVPSGLPRALLTPVKLTNSKFSMMCTSMLFTLHKNIVSEALLLVITDAYN